MGFLDIIFGALLVWGLFRGLKNGLFVELVSLIALIAGIYGAIHFSYVTGNYLSQHMNFNERYIGIASFLITFIIIVLILHSVGKVLTKVADFVMLGLLNKIAGGIFGALKVAVILGAFLVFFEKAVPSFVNEHTKKDNVLYTPIRDIGALVFSYVFKANDGSSSTFQASR